MPTDTGSAPGTGLPDVLSSRAAGDTFACHPGPDRNNVAAGQRSH